MPITQPPSYPILEDVMLLARTLVNDTFPGATGTPGEGQILTDTAPFTIPLINSAIRRVQRKLGNNDAATVIQDNVIVSGLTPVNGPLGLAIPDPSIQVSLSFAGYFDGTSTNASLKLPANTLAVERVWERTTGTQNPFNDMVPAPGALQSRNQMPWLGDWEYRQDALFFVGATLSTDIRMRLLVALAGLVTGAGTDFSSISVPIQDSTDALAWSIVFDYSFRLGTDAMQQAQAKFNEEVGDLVNRQVRAKQATEFNRQPYGVQGGWGRPFGQ